MSQAVTEQDWDLVASLAADLHDAHARLVEAVAAALVEGSWQAAGIRSPEHWLVVRAGLSRGQAAAVVLLARRAAELPATTALLREGRISLDQAAVVARHTPAAFDETVAEFARHATVPQLQRTVTRYDFTLEPRLLDDDGNLLPAERPTGPDAGAEHEAGPARPQLVAPASLSMGTGPDGRFRLRYEAPAEVGALVRAALAEAKDHLFRATGQGPDRHEVIEEVIEGDPAAHPGPHRVTWADALVLLATRSLESGTAPTRARRARYRVQVHLDTDGGWLTGTPRLPRHIADGLTCDGTLTPVWQTEGHPVNVGRSHRVVPHRTRVLVLDRDRGCRFPGCRASTDIHLEVHHLTHWRDGGPTDLANLLCLCTFHHDGHHRGEYTITGDPTKADGLDFASRYGLAIGPPARPPRADRRPATHHRPTEPAGPAESAKAWRPGPPPHPRPRPQPRLGRTYPAPTGGTLHLHLVDFTPTRAAPAPG